MELPLINLEREEAVEEIGNALRTFGFFYLYNHGIEKDLLQKISQLSERYFSLPMHEKLKHPMDSTTSGYVAFGQERLDEKVKHTEHKEAFNFFSLFTEKQIEALPPLFLSEWQTIQEFRAQSHSLCKKLMNLLARHLQLTEGENYFDEFINLNRSTSTTIRLLHYPEEPPIITNNNNNNNDGDDDKGGSNLDEVIIRCGQHSDYGALTLLFQDAIGGLQVAEPGAADDLDENDRRFFNVIPRDDCVIVNGGDLLQFWTNSFYLSAQHRVIAKPCTPSRYSFTYFFYPDDDVLIRPLQLQHPDYLSSPPSNWSLIRQREHQRVQSLAFSLPKPFNTLQYLTSRLNSSYITLPDPKRVETNPKIQQFHLIPHPEGGYWSDVYRHDLEFDSHFGPRNLCTCIYYLVTPVSPFGMFHRVRQVALNFWHSGRLLFRLVSPDGHYSEVVMGTEEGDSLQCIIPSNYWRSVCLYPGSVEGFFSEVCSFGFEYADHSPATLDVLKAENIPDDVIRLMQPFLYPSS